MSEINWEAHKANMADWIARYRTGTDEVPAKTLYRDCRWMLAAIEDLSDIATQSDADHRTMDARATELERELKIHQQRHALVLREIGSESDDWSPDAKNIARAVRDSLLMGGCDDCPPDCRFCAVDPECGCDVHPAADAASQPAVQDRKLPVCADCGHRHRWGSECAGHVWSDSCPYDAGADCETAVDQSVTPNTQDQYASVPAVTQPAEETNNG